MSKEEYNQRAILSFEKDGQEESFLSNFSKDNTMNSCYRWGIWLNLFEKPVFAEGVVYEFYNNYTTVKIGRFRGDLFLSGRQWTVTNTQEGGQPKKHKSRNKRKNTFKSRKKKRRTMSKSRRRKRRKSRRRKKRKSRRRKKRKSRRR